tara:strand:- start:679 stop:1170 length:492 start_codon:yes stop_codon:yes gene_type:complete
MAPNEIDEKTQGAVSLSVVNSGCLWWWTWMQFVTAFFYGLPLLTFDPAHTLWYYVPPDGWSTNLPKMFLGISILAVLILLLGTPIILAGSKAKIRQILLLGIFSTIAVGFSLVITLAEEDWYQSAKNELEWYRGDDLPWWASDPKWEIPQLESVIDAYEKSKH